MEKKVGETVEILSPRKRKKQHFNNIGILYICNCFDENVIWL